MDPYEPEGILPNVLRFVDRPGQVVRNVLAGRPGAAGRQIADILGELVDAPLPGDWIPSATKREDYISGSELVGMEQTPGVGRTLTDIGVGLATDPLTYLSFGVVPGMTKAVQAARAAGGTAKGAHTIELGLPFTPQQYRATLGTFDEAMDPLSIAMRGADTGITKAAGAIDARLASTTAGKQGAPLTKGYESAKAAVRRAVGAEKLTEDVTKTLQKGSAAASVGSKYWIGQAEDALKGLSPDERVLLGQAFYGVDAGTLVPRDVKAFAAMTDDPLTNVVSLSAKYGKDSRKMQDAAQKILDISQRQWDEGVSRGVFEPGAGQAGYLQRQWHMDRPVWESKSPGLASSLKERQLRSSTDVADFFNKHANEVGVELDAGKLLLNRAQQQGKSLGQATVARSMGVAGSLAGQDLRSAAKETIAQMHAAGALPGVDDAAALTRAIDGMSPREGILKALAPFNRFVKGPMVYGIVVPKLGSMVRNKMGMVFQALATPGARGQAVNQAATGLQDIGRAFDEAYGEVVFGAKHMARGDDIGKAMTDIEAAFTAAKSADEVPLLLRKAGKTDLAEAVENGVMDGFVSTEEVLTKLARTPGLQKIKDLRDAPAVMFSTLEQRGRLRMFLELKKAKPADEAALLTKDALYDYGINSPENRAMRDVLPFSQFLAKSVPQQAKLLSQKPAAAVGLAPLFYDPSGEEGPVYPWMQGKTRVGVGSDETGNPLYLSGFGLPVESLDVLPNLSADLRQIGRDTSQGLLSSTQPLLKTAAAVTTGRDPFFGTPVGSYGKIPLVGEAGDVGRTYNLVAGTGILEPFGANIIRQLGQATDEKKPVGARVADLLTGAKLTAVDPNIAEQQTLTNLLEAQPDVQQFRTFYMKEPTEEFSAVMQSMRDAKARAKDAREAASLASGDVLDGAIKPPDETTKTVLLAKQAAENAMLAANQAIAMAQQNQSADLHAQAMQAVSAANAMAAELKQAIAELKQERSKPAPIVEPPKQDKALPALPPGYTFEIERDSQGFIVGVKAKPAHAEQ